MISHSDFHDLSNLSNGGPPVSPNRLTLSPPSRGGLSPQYRPALSPTLSTNLIPATVPTSPPQPSSLHELLSRGQQQNQVRNISSTSSQSPPSGAGPNQVAEQLEPVQVSKTSNRSSSTQLLVHLQPDPCLSTLQVGACEELAPGQLDLEPEGAATAHELHLLHRRRLLHS